MADGVKNVSHFYTSILPMLCPPEAQNKYRELLRNGWRFYAVVAVRGRCHYGSKTLTIPIWALRKGKLYAHWYIAHEMAHAIAGHAANHGPQFMAVLKTLCEEEAYRFELTYKPKHAVEAGILDTNF